LRPSALICCASSLSPPPAVASDPALSTSMACCVVGARGRRWTDRGGVQGAGGSPGSQACRECPEALCQTQAAGAVFVPENPGAPGQRIPEPPALAPGAWMELAGGSGWRLFGGDCSSASAALQAAQHLPPCSAIKHSARRAPKHYPSIPALDVRGVQLRAFLCVRQRLAQLVELEQGEGAVAGSTMESGQVGGALVVSS
jgi:hypothetical protein